MTKRRKGLLIGGLILLVIVLGAMMRQSRSAAVEYSSVTAEQQDLLQTVSETGSVVADLAVEYGWEMSGRVIRVDKEVGDDVTAGDVIAQLENTQQRARLSEAQSRLASAQAALRLELAGPSNEQRAQSAAGVAQAEATLQQARVDLEKTIINSNASIRSAEIALADAEAALTNTGNTNQQAIDAAYQDGLQEANGAVIDSLSAMAVMSNIQHSYSDLTNSSATALQLATKKGQAVQALVGVPNAGKWRTDQIVNERGGVRGDVDRLLGQLNPDEAAIDRLLLDTQDMLNKMKAALDEMVVSLNATPDSSSTDKTSINTERASIDTELTAIVNAQQGISSAKLSDQSGSDTKQLAFEKATIDLDNAIQRAEQDVAASEAVVQVREAALQQSQAAYDALVAPPRDVDVGSLRANVSRELASVRQYQEDFDKTSLKALSDGVISELAVEVGENITANQQVVTIISPTLSIEVDVSESDIAKVAIDDPVMITLDAFGDDVLFNGHVLRVEPAETEISGVIYYKTDIVIDDADGRNIRPGMTANIDIETDKVENVVVVPQRAILEENGDRYVRIVTNAEKGEFEKKEVTLGLRGDSGLVEVKTGLRAGEEVVTFVKEE